MIIRIDIRSYITACTLLYSYHILGIALMVINASRPISAGFPSTGGTSSRLAIFHSFGVSLDLPTGGHCVLRTPVRCFINWFRTKQSVKLVNWVLIGIPFPRFDIKKCGDGLAFPNQRRLRYLLRTCHAVLSRLEGFTIKVCSTSFVLMLFILQFSHKYTTREPSIHRETISVTVVTATIHACNCFFNSSNWIGPRSFAH